MSMHSFRTTEAGVRTADGVIVGDVYVTNQVVAGLQEVVIARRGEVAGHEVVGSPVPKDIPLRVIVGHLTKVIAVPADLSTLNT